MKNQGGDAFIGIFGVVIPVWLVNSEKTISAKLSYIYYSKITTKYPLIIFFSLFFAGSSSAQDIHLGKTFRDCSDCPEMVVVPAGDFMMGSSSADTERDLAAVPTYDLESHLLSWFWPTEIGEARRFVSREHPQHQVTIAKSFGIGKYLITAGEFAAFVRETGYSTGPCLIRTRPRATHSPGAAWPHPGFAATVRDPVVCVTWEDAKAYIDWLNSKLRDSATSNGDGLYRLPSEAEWEFAARARTQTARWWGDAIGVAKAKCDGCQGLDDRWRTAPVGSFQPNQFGLYDMLGNAWQWTEDCWHENYIGAPTDGSAWTDAGCTFNTFRGGGWDSSPWMLRSATRGGGDKNDATSSQGFRVAKTLQ